MRNRSWTPSKVRYLADYINGAAFKPTDWSDRGTPIIRIQNLTDGTADYNYFAGTLPHKYLVSRGDILLPWSASPGVYIWDRDEQAWLNQHIFKVIPHPDIVSKRFFFWLASWFIPEMEHALHGSTMQHFTWNAFASFNVCLPPIEEQSLIADFLDREAAKSDALVAKYERLIDLLEEKRTALITQAITKGLDPSVPMKDSGVEWIGDIPKHWRLTPLKHIARITVGIVIEPSKYFVDEGKPFIHGSDINDDGTVSFENSKRISDADSLLNRKSMLHGNDLVCMRVGEPGRTAVVPEECAGGNCASVLLIRGSHDFDSHWLRFFLNSVGREQVIREQNGTAQQVLNVSGANNIFVPAPATDEQDAIAEYLLRAETEHQKIIRRITEAVRLLREHRAALITAAVTGQIDVRTYRSKHLESEGVPA